MLRKSSSAGRLTRDGRKRSSSRLTDLRKRSVRKSSSSSSLSSGSRADA